MAGRKERDALGEREVPAGAYFGIQTLRAIENFPISGLRSDPALIRAYARIKRAAAEVNLELGELDAERARLIAAAAAEVAEGALADQFPVDVFQAGAGTSLNMNVNEVVANRALEMHGASRGDYAFIHPNDHVNRSQSTNDTFPTAMRMAAVERGADLQSSLGDLVSALDRKAAELDDVLTSGRTHLQDAVPIRYGQVLRGQARALARVGELLEQARDGLRELPIGGTAVGTGLNAPEGFAARVVERLAEITGEPFRPGRDLVALMASQADVAHYSAAVRTLAIEITRFASDLRLLSSGPHTGLGDLSLPAVQPGSSIMPGKVNPSIPEMVDQVCFEVLGQDHTVATAARAGQLQLNVMMPVMAFALLFEIRILARAIAVLAERTVSGMTANRDRCAAHVRRSAALATLVSPVVGYARAAELTKEALRTGRSVADLLVERGVLDEAALDQALDPRRVTSPGSRP